VLLDPLHYAGSFPFTTAIVSVSWLYSIRADDY
jgi:hypothetical protein